MKHSAFRKIIFVLFLSLFATQLSAQQTSHKIVINEMNYLLYLPDGYEADTTRWPLMVFLHGAGETGDNVEKVKLHGPPKLIDQGKKYPFIVISPQSPQHGWRPEFVRKLIENISENYRVDADRIYLTGLSMGGYGTWNTAQTYPEMFAAIVPICGGGDPGSVWGLQNMPVWCFHGDKDGIVKLEQSQKMIDAMKPLDNPNVKFTVYPGVGHDSWTETYNNDEVYEWMLKHTRFKYAEVPVSDKLLNECAGKYTSSHNDTIRIEVSGKELQPYVGNQELPSFKAASDTKFYMQPTQFEYIQFERDADGKVNGITFVSSRYKNVYKKIE